MASPSGVRGVALTTLFIKKNQISRTILYELSISSMIILPPFKHTFACTLKGASNTLLKEDKHTNWPFSCVKIYRDYKYRRLPLIIIIIMVIIMV